MRLSAPAACTLYRAFTPRWAAEPLSGAGAARSGGRFNRFGQPALYLAMELQTAAAEYGQAAPFLPPFTLVTYAAQLPALADLRLLDADWDPLWADWAEDWRKALVNKVEPVSWVLGDLLREADIPGVIFPSVALAGGVNVALFLDRVPPERVLQVLDDGRLPRDGRSWEVPPQAP
ncbi:RES family NAD+ phosphorylase [Xanthomonas maliensis]|uniref:RES family NAD+ phosphorylase n=1 Tax=Xanthomonas maliensis TaxID=1321368 RepID=UPI00039D742A|nr:RES family NAD+ phosphorylase [Xanthomonas maliensis]KAB7769737.1 RES domain-containing protein [Xanthomonas maliensis]